MGLVLSIVGLALLLWPYYIWKDRQKAKAEKKDDK